MKNRNTRSPVGFTIRGLIFAGGGFHQVAQECGISLNALYRWQSVPSRHVMTMSRLTGLPPQQLRRDLAPPLEPQNCP